MKKTIAKLCVVTSLLTSTSIFADINIRGLKDVLLRNNIDTEMVVDKCIEKASNSRQTWFFVSYIDGRGTAKKLRVSCKNGEAVDYEIHRLSDKDYDDGYNRYRNDPSSGATYYYHPRTHWSDPS